MELLSTWSTLKSLGFVREFTFFKIKCAFIIIYQKPKGEIAYNKIKHTLHISLNQFHMFISLLFVQFLLIFNISIID